MTDSQGLNPKDIVGAKKAPLGFVPPALYIGAAEGMAIGADKYGPFNWRGHLPIQYMTYVEAMLRHLLALVDGQDLAEDTGVHHLKHVLPAAAFCSMPSSPAGWSTTARSRALLRTCSALRTRVLPAPQTRK